MQPKPASTKHAFRQAFESLPTTITSITKVHTGLLELSPAFLDALKKVAPKRRRSKLPLVILLAILTVVGALAADGSTREFVASHVRDRLHRVAAPPPPAASPSPVTLTAAVVPSEQPAAPAPAPAISIAPRTVPIVGSSPSKPEASPSPAKKSIASPMKKSVSRPTSRKARKALVAAQMSLRGF